jgi:hypothetical protein
MQVNEKESGVISGVGMDKLKIVIDGVDRGTVESQATRDLARTEASNRGFGAGGLCENAIVGPIGPDGEMLDGADALDPSIQTQGFRAEFMFAQRM